ncbi:MAG: BlaI/MecI/CopY family transcriptional regulator [Verrucomicrobiota bacterium]
MPDFSQLSRRERQIMDILFAKGEATVLQIQSQLPEAPTPMAIRRLLSILIDKGFLAKRKNGREMVYRPKEERSAAGRHALRRVLDTFFSGSLESAISAHFDDPNEQLSAKEIQSLRELIDNTETKS